MSLIKRLRERIYRWSFLRVVKAVLRTPPVRLAPSGYTALSMVHHRDVLPYLLAIKSIAHRLPPAAVVVVADPTLNAVDRAIIATHIPGIRFREAADARVPGVPVGGCWERLLSIADECQRSYVVQVDADLLAIGHLDAVEAAIASKVCFTLGTEDNQTIVSSHEAARQVTGPLSDRPHVQALAESLLSRFDSEGRYRYVRGCAGFAGFAPGSIDVARIQKMSARMSEVMGDRWSEWGTEQFASNLLVATSPGAVVLPHPEYSAPTRYVPKTVLLHFIGFLRFRSELYAELTKKTLGELKR